MSTSDVDTTSNTAVSMLEKTICKNERSGATITNYYIGYVQFISMFLSPGPFPAPSTQSTHGNCSTFAI